ncbi:MAG: alpha/beta hydrolase [Chloroflexota bacterium]|jgi:acetyl esterase|nr:alpha/beta hydrolase [Chloroflexota bacterium]
MTRSTTHAANIDLSHSLSRRLVLGGGAALAAGAAFTSQRRAFAQGATPIASPAPGGMPVDPQMQEVLDALAAFEAPALNNVTPQVGRNLPSFANAVQAVLTERGEPSQEEVGAISHALFPALDGTELVARIYRPLDAGDELLPVLVYFHGGGFVIANLDTYDASCRALANATGCLVASVAYRQAPENPFPTAADDAYAATQYFIGAAGAIGGDPERVAVGGESAGGNLATVVALRSRIEGTPMPVHQLLVYPVATFAPEGESLESIEQFATAAPLSAAALEWFGMYYLPDMSAAMDPYASPLLAEDLSGLPPATVIQAQIDPLQSQGTVYAEALEAAGVPVTRSLYEGVTHEFFGMGQVVDKAAEAVEEAAAALRSSFGM